MILEIDATATAADGSIATAFIQVEVTEPATGSSG